LGRGHIFLASPYRYSVSFELESSRGASLEMIKVVALQLVELMRLQRGSRPGTCARETEGGRELQYHRLCLPQNPSVWGEWPNRESGVLDVFCFLARLLADLFRSRSSLEAELLALRQQLNLLRRSASKRLTLRTIDRLIFVGLYLLFPGVLDAVTIVRPQTILRWHRSGFRAFWRWKSRSCVGRPCVPSDIRRLIREMSRANPLWGAPRLHGELLKLGIDIGQTSVAKYMVRYRRPPSPGWRTFLTNHAEGIASIDLFVVPTISFRLLYGLLVLRHDRRRILWFGVTSQPTSEWIARQVTEAIGWEEAPAYLIRDRDRAYGEVFRRRIRSMGIRDRPIAARSPWQNGYAERLIGSIRRECLDHVVIFGEPHLSCVLRAYKEYYNRSRTHLSLNKDAPLRRPVQLTGAITPIAVLGGFHHRYVRI